MAKSVCVNLYLPDFTPVADFKLYSLEEDFDKFENQIPIEDRYGRRTSIYTQI